MRGDADKLTQVVTNLISNAAKFSPKGDCVEVGLEALDGWARVTVTDHGPGIPVEFQERIFEKFSQADSTDRRRKGGSGLGLSICKAIVEQHGGRIGFASREKEGATFHFTLPATTPRDHAKSGPKAPPGARHSGARKGPGKRAPGGDEPGEHGLANHPAEVSFSS